MNKIKGFFYFIFCVVTIFLVIVAMKLNNKNNHRQRQIWAKFQRYFIGYKLEQIGEFAADVDMLVLNHKSMLDIIILEEIYPGNLAWVAKKEIGEIKVLGAILRLPKMIAIDRSNPRSIVQLVKDAKDRLENGRVIAIFPEGTRGKSDKLLKFHDGAKILATKLNLRIQPVVLKNTLEHLDVKNLSVKGGLIKAKILPPIAPNSDDWYAKLREDMQKAYDEL